MPEYGQMVLEQRGERKIDAYPNILPPKGPPPPVAAAAAPRRPWWWRTYCIIEATIALATKAGLSVSKESMDIYLWLLARKARLANEGVKD